MLQPSAASSQAVNIPAPVGGWNARDPLSEMSPTDAITLENWWPTASDVRVREGSSSFATGMSGNIETLMTYSSTSANKMFAVTAAGNAYDVSSAGAVGAASTTFTNGRIQWENVTTAAGNFLYCCNGVDKPQYYNGAAWANPAITNVTDSTLFQPLSFKSRLFFAQTASLSLWYLPVNSIAGAATELPLGGIFRLGGYISSIATWTLDAGRGVDDHLVIITSKGEVAVYAGTDPTSATSWSLVGVYMIGAPVGRNCFAKYGGDLLIICLDGIFPLSIALQSTRIDNSQAITDKIRTAISEATGTYGSYYGWSLTPYPDKNALLLNVPTSSTTAQQYVMNGITGAWTKFTGWNAWSMTIYNNNLYFGGDGVVYRAWTGTSDNGTNILADAKPAFNHFGIRGRKKAFYMVKPYVASSSTVAPAVALNVDFADDLPTGSPTATASSFAVWDSSTWDKSTWGGDLMISKKWMKVHGVGYCASLRMRIATNTSEVRWYSTDFMVSAGGIL